MAMASQVLQATAANEQMQPHVRLFTAGLPSSEAPRWYYQDLQGQLQGPFDASTMSRWCGENALPLDLKCLGVHAHDSNLTPNSAHLSLFQPLQKLLDNAAAGMQYSPAHLAKGSLSDEGPATPQSAAPQKGARAGGAAGPANHIQGQAGTALATSNGLHAGSQDSRSDVTRAADQRASLAAAAAAAAVASSGGLNGLPLAQQHQGLQGSSLLQHLQLAQQQHQGMANHAQQLQQQRPGQRQGSAPRRAGQQQTTGTQPNHQFHEQHANLQQQHPAGAGGGMLPGAGAPQQAAAAAGATADGPAEISPGTEAWEAALLKLLSREAFSGKEADVKWRVILASGDRVGPFSTEQMTDWLLSNKAPKGINKQQAAQTAANPAALQVAGIISADYNAQRLPGAKFFKPLSHLLPAVAAGMLYEAVNKHDLQRGLPKPGWNDGPSASSSAAAASKGAAPGAAQPPLPGGGKGGRGQQGGKAAKAAAAAGGGAAFANTKAQQQGPRSNQMQGSNRSRSSTPGGGPAGAFPDGADSSSSKASSFKHPMALRQQQRQQQQQEALLAGADAAGVQSIAGTSLTQPAGGQFGKGFAGASSRVSPMPHGSASRGILMAANSMGGAAGSQQAQQQAFAGSAVAQQAAMVAAAGRFAQGQQQPLTPQQQQQMQQMQAASMAFLQTPQGAQQAVWLKQQQQQLPGQALSTGQFPAMQAGQALLGYSMPGYQMPGQHPGDAAAAGLAGLPRTSSSGSSALQQQAQVVAPGQPYQQQQPAAAGAGAQQWQQQQQPAAPGRPTSGYPPGQAGTAAAGNQPEPLHSPQMMHAAALLFLADHQQQLLQPAPERPQVRWWVQRNERAFSGPFSGLQMYQAYLNPSEPLRLTETTPIAAVSATASALQGSGRDVPPTRAFAPLGPLLEAASQGYCLVPWPLAADPTGANREAGPAMPHVRHAATGTVVPLQSVVAQSNALLLMLQQQQQAASSSTSTTTADAMQWAGTSSSDQEASSRSSIPGQQQQVAAGPKPLPQGMIPGARPAAQGGFIQLPNGSMIPAGLVPMQGGGLAMLPANAAAAPPAPPAVDPLTVASALFTAGGLPPPHSPVWYLLTQGAAGEGPQRTASSSTQGPLEPQEMLAMFRDGRLGPSSLVCATHRATAGQQQVPPPPAAFQPLQLLMSSASSDVAVHHAGAAAAGGQMPAAQLVPAGMVVAQAQGGMGPVLFQVPVSSAAGQPAMVAMPAGLQMQQLAQMQAVPQIAGAQGMPYMQTPQGMLVPQHMMSAAAVAGLAAQQQQAQQQQQQQAAAAAGQAGTGGPTDGGPSSTGGSSSTSAATAAAAAAHAQQLQPAGSSTAADASSVQRAGAAPPRVDTWGSLAAAQELVRRPSASSSNGGQQTPAGNLAQQGTAGSQAIEAALAAAASGRRASQEGFHAQALSAGMMLSGGQHPQQQFPHHMQMQHQFGSSGPRSGPIGAPHAFGGHHQQHGYQMAVGPRSASASRALQHDSAAAAAAAAALAGSMNLYGSGHMQLSQQQQQQQLHMASALHGGMSGHAPGHAAMLQGQAQHLQQQQQQQAAALAAASAAPPAPVGSPARPAGAAGGEVAAAASTPVAEAPAEPSEPAAAAGES